jgi:hypothetical protein
MCSYVIFPKCFMGDGVKSSIANTPDHMGYNNLVQWSTDHPGHCDGHCMQFALKHREKLGNNTHFLMYYLCMHANLYYHHRIAILFAKICRYYCTYLLCVDIMFPTVLNFIKWHPDLIHYSLNKLLTLYYYL